MAASLVGTCSWTIDPTSNTAGNASHDRQLYSTASGQVTAPICVNRIPSTTDSAQATEPTCLTRTPSTTATVALRASSTATSPGVMLFGTALFRCSSAIASPNTPYQTPLATKAATVAARMAIMFNSVIPL